MAAPRLRVALVVAAALAATTTATMHQSPAYAYWTDTATITSGPFTTWTVGNLSCPDPQWGTNTVLTWSAPTGTSATVSIALIPTSPPVTGQSSWTTSLRPGSPLTTSGIQAGWGVGTASLYETAHFDGTWTLVATSPGGAWTATRTGTWSIYYTDSSHGTATCTVDEVSGP